VRLRLDREAAQATEPDLTTARGLVALARGDLGAARAALTRAYRLDPNREEVMETFGHLELAAGNPAEALRWFARGTEVDRGYLPFHDGRARALLALADAGQPMAARRGAGRA
jgi:tetratricopeptide (TPR) repeat protein